jgi:hypothetical protein
MRRTVADIVLRTMERMKPSFPEVSEEEKKRMLPLREELEAGPL